MGESRRQWVVVYQLQLIQLSSAEKAVRMRANGLKNARKTGQKASYANFDKLQRRK